MPPFTSALALAWLQPHPKNHYNPNHHPCHPLDLGVLTVAEGAVAYLAHPEHAYSGIAPGTYLLRRQREVDASRVLPQPVTAAPAPRTPPAPRVRYVAD
jgi:hypothetical protein